MMTVITTMELQPGAQEEWEELIQERFRSAHGRNGWVAGQLLTPSGSPDVRVIVGTWRTRAPTGSPGTRTLPFSRAARDSMRFSRRATRRFGTT